MTTSSIPGATIDLVASIVQVIIERVTGKKLTKAEARAKAFEMLRDPPRKTALDNEDELRKIAGADGDD